MDIEHIFKIIKKHRNRASRKYNEVRSKSVHCDTDDAYYNGKMRVLDELKKEIKEALK